MALLLQPLYFLIILVPETFILPNFPTLVTPPFSKASDAYGLALFLKISLMSLIIHVLLYIYIYFYTLPCDLAPVIN